MSKYTAGPWLMQHEFDDEPTYIVGPGGEDIATIPPGGLAIARLIAAAPELLAALEEFIRLDDECLGLVANNADYGGELVSALHAAKLALAKAHP